MGLGPFDFVKSINSNKDIMLTDLDEKDYNPFLVNRALSYFPDTIRVADLMNKNSDLDNRMQYSCYINIIRAKQRFSKWAKTTTSDDLELIKSVYGYSDQKARNVLTILTKKQVEELRQKVNRRGKKE